jgi:pilus assembly protein Flp/PilA
MKDRLLLLQVQLLNLLSNEDGQDLIEYALVVALIAFGATASMSTLGKKLDSVFSTITTQLTVV